MGSAFKTLHDLSLFSPSTASFEDTYKTAYSHGLEEIYALENVDIKSVKPIQIFKKEKKKKTPQKILEQTPLQLYFNFGGEFQYFLQPYVLSEPIQVLDISRALEKKLLELELFQIQHLLQKDLSELIFIKGFGKGHIDEIESKLSDYLSGKELVQTNTFYTTSFIKCLTAAFDKKMAKEGLKAFQLDDWIELTPIEGMEIRRLTPEKRKEWEFVFHEHMRKSKDLVIAMMKDVVNVLIKPWMRKRQGIASRLELVERLQRVSDDVEMVENVIEMLETLVFNRKNFFEMFLSLVDEEVYCIDSISQKDFCLIVQIARTYFYKTHITYFLSELTFRIQRELVKKWENISQYFIEKVLRMSSDYIVRKGKEGRLVIQLS